MYELGHFVGSSTRNVALSHRLSLGPRTTTVMHRFGVNAAIGTMDIFLLSSASERVGDARLGEVMGIGTTDAIGE